MKKAYLIPGAAAVVGITAVITLFSAVSGRTDETAYRDVTVKYGVLVVDPADSAPLSHAMTGQYFDLDITALAGEAAGAQGLQIDKVLVSTGQQVQKGTPLLHVTADSVQRVRTALQKEILDRNKDYEILKSRQKELQLQASQGYDNNIVSGRYAGLFYSDKRGLLQEKAESAKEAVDRKQDQINENLLKLTQAQQDLAETQKYLREAENAVSENYSGRYDNAYYYTVYENTRETVLAMVEQLEKEIEERTARNETLLYEVDEASRAYHQAILDQERENLAAKRAYDAEIYHAETASEQYDIQMARLDGALEEAREHYESALHNIRVFDAYIVRGRVLSEHSGVIAEIMAEAGESIAKNDVIVTFYGADAKKVLCVPEKAVFRDGERSYVMIRHENGDIMEKTVATGISDGTYTEITKGLSEGDVVLEAVRQTKPEGKADGKADG